MENFKCGGWARAATKGEIFECPHCGNHVCASCAERSNFMCPNCFAKLCAIS